MTTPLRGGFSTEDPRLDRIPLFDERSRNFQIREAIDRFGAYEPRSYTWSVGTWLDQGQEGACVGFSLGHELAARPVKARGIDNRYAREEIYWNAQRSDPWEGGSYPGASPQYEGTAVLSGALVCRDKGHFEEIRWVGAGSQRPLEDLIQTVGYFGPVVLGINWYQGMFRPDANGFIRPTGNIAGGHAILCYSVNVRGQYFKLHNSWGFDWGDKGTCKVAFTDMQRLLEEDGEGCVPLKRKLIAA